MFGAIWTPLGGKVADKWAALLLSPVLAFWGGGVLAWVYGHGGFAGRNSGWRALDQEWRQSFDKPTAAAQVALIILALLIVAASARIVETLTLPALRLLEGYWPRWAEPLRKAMVRLRSRRIDRDAARWRELAVKKERTGAEQLEYARLDAGRAAAPAVPSDRMPTRIGDLLRAAEARPRQRYGLDTVTCWPRLWLVLPDQCRTEIGAARTKVDEAATVWIVAVAFAVWTYFTWWALAASIVVAAIAYRVLLSAATDYAVLLQSCFDVHRESLYEALGVPWDTRAEPQDGLRITAHLARGTALGEQE